MNTMSAVRQKKMVVPKKSLKQPASFYQAAGLLRHKKIALKTHLRKIRGEWSKK